ncbi:MAG: GTP pyrophosphokinase family protein [Sandaracinaceae bacterium]
MSHERILGALDARRDTLGAAAGVLERALRAWLEDAGLEVHSVTSRLKRDDSLRRKLARPDRTYRALWDVTDLVGVRVVTYFEDAIEDVARIIEERFAVDYRHSTDKLRFRDHGRFGYRSMHYVCAFPPELGLDAEARFEIQIRTVLQHAWAEVEHDLGYKPTVDRADDVVPELIRRRFSRIASLLEIADEEFVSIRRDLRRYRERVQSEVAAGTRGVPVDTLSLETAARAAPVEALDREIAAILGAPLGAEVFFPGYLARMLRLVGLETTEDLRRAVAEHAAVVPRLVGPYLEFARTELALDRANLAVVQRGYALLFVAHAEVMRGPALGLSKVARLTRMYAELDFDGDERRAHEVASGLVRALTLP